MSRRFNCFSYPVDHLLDGVPFETWWGPGERSWTRILRPTKKSGCDAAFVRLFVRSSVRPYRHRLWDCLCRGWCHL